MEEDKKNLHRVKFLDYKSVGGVTYYSISVTTLVSAESWIFEARYSRMLDLHKEISASFELKLPAFPPKKWPGNLNPDFISQRQKSLENYFNNLLKVVNIDHVAALKRFLYQGYKRKDEKLGTKPVGGEAKGGGAKPPVAVHKEEEKQAPAPNVAIKPNFDKIIENTKFVDLNMNLASPDEDEVKEKKEKYKTLNFNLKIKLPKSFSLPENRLLKNIDEVIYKPSLPSKEAAFIKEVRTCMDSLIHNMESFELYGIKTQMIHCFQS